MAEPATPSSSTQDAIGGQPLPPGRALRPRWLPRGRHPHAGCADRRALDDAIVRRHLEQLGRGLGARDVGESIRGLAEARVRLSAHHQHLQLRRRPPLGHVRMGCTLPIWPAGMVVVERTPSTSTPSMTCRGSGSTTGRSVVIETDACRTNVVGPGPEPGGAATARSNVSVEMCAPGDGGIGGWGSACAELKTTSRCEPECLLRGATRRVVAANRARFMRRMLKEVVERHNGVTQDLSATASQTFARWNHVPAGCGGSEGLRSVA